MTLLKYLLTFFKVYFEELPPKNIEIGIIKTLAKIMFFMNLTKNLAKGLSIRKNNISIMSLQIFLECLLISMLQKRKKVVRGNETLFMTKELSKAIMNRSKL